MNDQGGIWPAIAAGTAALAIAMGIGRFVYTPILPIMATELDLTQSQVGVIASVNFIGYLMGALMASTPWIVGNRQSWVIAGLIVNGLTSVLMGIVVCELAFWFLRFLSGIASAFVMVYVSAIVIQTVSHLGHPSYATVHFAGVGIGIAVSALLVAFLAAHGAAWQQLWVAAGMLSLAGVLLVWWLLPDIDFAGRDRRPSAIDWSLLPLILAYGFFGFGYVITATFIVAIAGETDALMPIAPWIWLIAGLAGAPSVAFWLWIARCAGLLRAFSFACIIEAVGVAFSVMWISIPGMILAAIFLGGTFMGITALGLMAARQSISGDPSRMLALMTACFGLGQIIGPGFAGVLTDWQESYLAPSLAASAALVLAACLVHLRGRPI